MDNLAGKALVNAASKFSGAGAVAVENAGASVAAECAGEAAQLAKATGFLAKTASAGKFLGPAGTVTYIVMLFSCFGICLVWN